MGDFHLSIPEICFSPSELSDILEEDKNQSLANLNISELWNQLKNGGKQPQQSHPETNKRVNIFPREATPQSDVFLFDQFNASHMHHSNLTTLMEEGLSNLCRGKCVGSPFSVSSRIKLLLFHG